MKKLLLFAEQPLLSNNLGVVVVWNLKAMCLLFAVEWTDKMLAVFLTG